MPRRVTILYSAAEVAASAWPEVRRTAEAWSRAHPEQPFLEVADILRKLILEDEELLDAWDEVESELAARTGARPQRSTQQLWSQEELRDAPYAKVSGQGLDSGPGGFFAKSPRRLRGDPHHCERCGHTGHSWRPRGPLEVNEALLDAPAERGGELVRPGPDGWCLVNLPGQGLAISVRLLSVWREAGLTGWSTLPLVDKGSKQACTRIVQLIADARRPAPSAEHTPYPEGAFCPACGKVFESVPAPWCFALDGEPALFSRDPLGHAQLYFSREARRLVQQAKALGMSVSTPARVCPEGAG